MIYTRIHQKGIIPVLTTTYRTTYHVNLSVTLTVLITSVMAARKVYQEHEYLELEGIGLCSK